MKRLIKKSVKRVLKILHLNENKTIKKIYRGTKLYKCNIGDIFRLATFSSPLLPAISQTGMENGICGKSVKYVNKNLCTGCGCCLNICPNDAIKMIIDTEGFWAPEVDKNKCVDCGLCMIRCPIDNLNLSNQDKPECFGIIVKDSILRMKSASGGFFGVLAEYVRNRGGYVFGAAFTRDLNLRHIAIAPEDSLEPLHGSKYLQSHIGFSMREAKKLLEEGKWVLFTGTPCQIAGLNNYLNKKYDTLLTAEVMCGGGGSPGAFKKYIKDNFPDQNFRNYFFRAKDLINWGHSEILATENNELLAKLKNASDYFQVFKAGISTRVSCGECQASSLPRQADFTLADAWLISQISKSLDDGYGTSLISINNKRAKQVFAELRHKLSKCESVSLDWVLTNGQPMNHPFQKTPSNHKRFFELLETNTFKRAKTYALENRYDVAVLGVWFGHNYGSVLTYYSLYSFLRELGLLVLMVEKPIKGPNDKEHDPEFHSRKFAAKYYGDRISKFYTPQTLWELNNYVDTFLIGSDQIFHANLINYFQHAYLLNFVGDTKKKIAFAASFGHAIDRNHPANRKKIERFLKRFDYLGIREKSGVEILRDKYGIYDAEWVIDPIFLHDKNFYKTLADDSTISIEENYILAYILDPTPEISILLHFLSKRLKLKLIVLADGRWYQNLEQSPYSRLAVKHSRLAIQPEKNIETQDLLKYFCHASYIITDSFHGLCLSIIFEKQFMVIANHIRGLTRFENILDITKLHHRFLLYPNMAEVLLNLVKPIDYEATNILLHKKIDETKAWIKKALFAPKIIRNNAKWDLVAENDPTFNSPDDIYLTLVKDQPHIQFCKDFDEYLKALVNNKDQYLILISIKDTPGDYLTKDMQKKLTALGIKANLYHKLWYSFIAIIEGGVLRYEDKEDNLRITYEGELSGKKIIIDSAPFHKGNIANIIIDGINYSLNKRGFNFVIIDKNTNLIIDIVSFDTHVPQISCFRVH